MPTTKQITGNNQANTTKTKLLQIIKQDFPNLTWKSAKHITTGYDNDIIALDNTTIFRFPKNAYSKKLLKNEIALLKILADYISTSVPAYTFFAKNYSYAAYPMIKGEELTVKKYNSLSAKQKNELTKQIALFLTELHAIPFSQIKKCRVRERATPEQELRKLHKEAKKYLYSNFSSKERNAVEIFFSKLTDAFQQSYKKTLLHGDFSGDNMVIDQNRQLAGVIDFTDRAIHDPAFDFVYMWAFGEPFVQSVYTNYNGNKIGVLQRSKVYAQARAIWKMTVAVKKKTPDYTKWHRRFKKLNHS